MQTFAGFVPSAVFDLIRQDRIELLLILECSTGTKYAGVKNMLIDTAILSEHKFSDFFYIVMKKK